MNLKHLFALGAALEDSKKEDEGKSSSSTSSSAGTFLTLLFFIGCCLVAVWFVKNAPDCSSDQGVQIVKGINKCL